MRDQIISDNDYRIIADSLQNKKDIRRKANLNLDEINTCLISHVLYEIDQAIRKKENISIAELLDISAEVKEELSLSNRGFGIKLFSNIMTNEKKIRNLKEEDKREIDVE